MALLTLSVTGCDRAPSSPPPDVPAVAAPVSKTDPTTEKLSSAINLQREGKLAESRSALQELAITTNVPDQVFVVLGEVNSQILFSAAPAPEKEDYTIVAGDSLGKLASKFGTTIELIRKANNITGDKIRVGDRLRIYQGKFAVEISKSANTLTVTDDGKFFKRYRVGTGQYAKTPVGEFKITSRIENPPWYRSDGKTIPFGDPENILGTHWLGINVAGYGIHGTWDTNSIGKQASAGCVRLLNDDVAELYIILPIGTTVTIHD